MADSYTFKVFSGPHNGLVFDLKPGHYRLGKGTDNDLIFSDEEMGNSAAEIDVTPFEITITINDPAYQNGQQIGPGQHKWESGSFIQLGDTLICYRAASIKGPWKKPSFNSEPEAPAVSPAATEENQPQESDKQSDDSTVSEVKPKDGSEIKTAETSESAQLIENIDKKTIVSAVLGGLVLLLLLVLLMFGSSIFRADAIDEDLEALNSAIEQHGFKDLKVSVNDDIIDLSGSVESKVRFAELTEAIPELKSTLNMNVEVRDDEILGVERDFSILGFNVRAHYIDDGKIGVDGYMSDAYVQAEAFNSMESRYKNRLKGRIVYRQELEHVLKENCEHHGVRNIQLVLGKGSAFYKGRTTLEVENALETARYETAQKLGIPLKFTRYDPKANTSVERLEGTETVELSASSDEQFTSLSEKKAEVSSKQEGTDELAILSVTMKPMRFITLKNGRKYFEGGVLPSGYVVSSIDLNKVILVKGNDIKELQLK